MLTKYVIMQICGGLGNQLFQIANAYHLSIKYNRTLLLCIDNSYPRCVYWDTIFSHFKKCLITKKNYNELRVKSTIYNWAMTRFEYKEIIIDHTIDIFCIEGYYQSYKYFDKLQFEQTLNIDTFTYLKPSINDVALHIRRTDYTKNNFHKVISLDYYYNCLRKIMTQIDINRIYIFSDDINWCKQHFDLQHAKTVDAINAVEAVDAINAVEFVDLSSDVEELCFMKQFKTIVVANSSFSWWAAYLGREKVIYSPENWFNNGCHLITRDLRPTSWIQIDDDLHLQKTFNSNEFNVISFGSSCCMVQNIHDTLYSKLGPLYRQPDNATNFFDWIIVDFKSIAYIFDNLKYRDDSFLNMENFTFNDNNAMPSQLVGGWSSVYRKIEHVDQTMIFLHDVRKENSSVPKEFLDKYRRRFERLYNKILDNDIIHFTHCFDFQWLKPYFPNVDEFDVVFDACKLINPLCNVNIHLLVHPKYNTEDNREIFNNYEKIKNVHVFYLKDKGFHADWKANNLTFSELFIK